MYENGFFVFLLVRCVSIKKIFCHPSSDNQEKQTTSSKNNGFTFGREKTKSVSTYSLFIVFFFLFKRLLNPQEQTKMSIPSFADKARSLYIHIGDADDRPLVSKNAFMADRRQTSSPSRGTFLKFHGIPESEFENTNASSSRGRGIGAGDMSKIGPDAVDEIQTRDKERIITTVRERRRRQLEERAAVLAEREAAKLLPKELSGEVLEKLNVQQERRRQLLEAMSNTQWVHAVEIGRAAQISIALGERMVGRTIAAATAKRTTSSSSAKTRKASASPNSAQKNGKTSTVRNSSRNQMQR